MMGGPGKEHRTNKLPQARRIQERLKGDEGEKWEWGEKKSKRESLSGIMRYSISTFFFLHQLLPWSVEKASFYTVVVVLYSKSFFFVSAGGS